MMIKTPTKPATRPTTMRGPARSRSNIHDAATFATGLTDRTSEALSAVVYWTPK